MTQKIRKVPASQLQELLYQVFLKHGFREEKANTLARVHMESTLDGINSHGINRVPLFIEYVNKGVVDPGSEALQVEAFGSMERWDGQRASGVLNAISCTKRAIELAQQNGMALVALRNTNHWMRGGTYGWLAARAGCISICFTNTIANMPPWGGKDSRIGNNPFIVSIPRENGKHVVLDMALSQFAFGKIHDYQLKGEQLPYPGGWDEHDELSMIPEKILASERGLPIGYWKGSAMSVILDMLATILSAGDSTCNISARGIETGISQVFLCIDPEVFPDKDLHEKLLDEIISYTHDAEPMSPGGSTYYPGERTLQTRNRNLKDGIPVSEEVWNEVEKLTENE
jgi:3-dehydro-L-gulonate 2-dehydrogenase